MTEPIGDDESKALRRALSRAPDEGIVLTAFATISGWHNVRVSHLLDLLARLDAAEAKLERIKQIVNPGQYLSLGMLVEIKEIVYD